MAENTVRLSSQEIIALEDKYGCRNYEPVPVVLSRGEGECYILFPWKICQSTDELLFYL